MNYLIVRVYNFFIIEIEGGYENTEISSKYVMNIELERWLSDLNILINAHNQIRYFIHVLNYMTPHLLSLKRYYIFKSWNESYITWSTLCKYFLNHHTLLRDLLYNRRNRFVFMLVLHLSNTDTCTCVCNYACLLLIHCSRTMK